MSNKSGLLVYREVANTFNVGDYIQSLAAQGFVGDNNVFINREEASKYSGDEIKLIMNGWFTHTKNNDWIPSDKIYPLFISFHLNSSAMNTILNNEGKDYLKKHQPIGCRDQYTAKILNKNGIEAYFSGCLTLTLDRYKINNIERKGIYIVDPLYNYPSFNYLKNHPRGVFRYLVNGNIFKLNKIKKHMAGIFSESLLDQAEYINQVISGKGMTHRQKFEIADSLLRKYATAKLVITSRIHCALPCLAMGTPVIYINGFDNFVDTCRFDGILDLFNRIDINIKTGAFSANFEFTGNKIDENIIIKNKDDYLLLANKMKKICNKFTQDI